MLVSLLHASKMTLIKTLLFLCLCTCLYPHTLGAQKQSPLFKVNYNEDNGLAASSITKIVEDDRGFIWLATPKGLFRFDGLHSKEIKSKGNADLENGLKQIEQLVDFGPIYLFIKSKKSSYFLNKERGEILQDEAISNLQIQAAHQAADSSFWVATKNAGLLKMDPLKLKTIWESKIFELDPKDQIIDFFKHKEKIYLGTKQGNIHIQDLESEKWTSAKNKLTKDSYSAFIKTAGNRCFLISTTADLIEFNLAKLEFSYSPLHELQTNLIGINAAFYDKKDKKLLISTFGQGLFIYNFKDNSIEQFEEDNPRINLSSNFLLSITKDRNDHIWVGHDGEGIDAFGSNINKFQDQVPQNEDALSKISNIRAIHEDSKGILWYGSAGGGLIKFDKEDERYQFYSVSNGLRGGENFILSICEANDKIFLGFNGTGIGIFNPQKGNLEKIIKVGNAKNQVSNGKILSLLYDQKSNCIWAGTRDNGLNKIELPSLSVKQYNERNTPKFGSNSISMLHLEGSRLFIGTEKGLFEHDAKEDLFVRLYPTNTENIENNTSSVNCLVPFGNKGYLIGTDGGGLLFVDKSFKLQKIFNAKNQLNDNVVQGIIAQGKNTFWLSTNKGISKLNWPDEGKEIELSNYNKSNGLRSDEYNSGAFKKLSNGLIAFGGEEGVDIFRGSSIQKESSKSELAIISFSLPNTEIKFEKLISYKEKVDLKQFENSFRIQYSVLGFVVPNKINYRYKLIGYDQEWNNVGNKNFADYNKLPSGFYEFRVISTDMDGIWNEEYTSLFIEIATPFYEEIWFYLLLGIILSLILYARYRSQKARREEKEEIKLQYTKELAQVEMKALRAQINPHFIFNSLNSVNSFILKNENEKARKYLSKFSMLVRNTLNNSSNSFISLQEELDTLTLYIELESIRFDNTFSYDIHVDDDVDVNQIMLPSLLLQPYIENAIWHGLMHKKGEKTINIIIKKRMNEILSIEIIDNGVGREEAKKMKVPSHNKSYGMQLGENRLKLLNTKKEKQGRVLVLDLTDFNNKPTGTKIHILIPLDNENL